MKNKRKYIKLACVAAIIVALDLLSKAVILSAIPLYHSIAVIPGFFNITHIQNAGGAFGILAKQGSSLRDIFFFVASSLAVCLIFLLYKNTPKTHPLLATGFAMILGGAVGNMIDRLRFGKVVDFLDLYMGNYHWPAFNVADCAITIGVGIFIYHILFNKLPSFSAQSYQLNKQR